MTSDEFRSAMETVMKETTKNEGNLVKTWVNLRKSWMKHYRQIPEKMIRNRTNLLMAVRFTECYQSLVWIEWLALRGGYYQVCRELRSILEGVLQAFYIDMIYRDLNIHGKLAVLKEMTLERSNFGGKLIGKAKPPETQAIQELYKKLSDFVHTSVNFLSEVLGQSDSDSRIVNLVAPKYDSKLFKICCSFSERVMHHITSINQALIDAFRT